MFNLRLIEPNKTLFYKLDLPIYKNYPSYKQHFFSMTQIVMCFFLHCIVYFMFSIMCMYIIYIISCQISSFSLFTNCQPSMFYPNTHVYMYIFLYNVMVTTYVSILQPISFWFNFPYRLVILALMPIRLKHGDKS